MLSSNISGSLLFQVHREIVLSGPIVAEQVMGQFLLMNSEQIPFLYRTSYVLIKYLSEQHGQEKGNIKGCLTHGHLTDLE